MNVKVPVDRTLKEILSRREFEAAGYVRDGFENKDIAAFMGVCLRTVGHHLEGALNKSGCPNRVRLAVRFEREYPE